MELKTLKDIEFIDCMYIPSDEGIKRILKSVIINWIKELQKPVINLGKPEGNEFLLQNSDEFQAKAQIRILKHLFGVTEKDVSEGETDGIC